MNLILRVMTITSLLAVLTSAQSLAPNQAPRGSLLDLHESRLALRKLVPASSTFDIILITVDAAQVDRLAAFGGMHPEPMPNLDKLANRSVVFSRAYSSSPHRQTALISIHHSLYPTTITGIGSTSKTDSIASVMADSGYYSWAILRYGILKKSKEPIGELATKFDFDNRRCANRREAQSIREIYEKRASDRRSGERFFGWIHLNYPYPPARFHPGINLGNTAEDHYRASLRYTDRAIGELVDAIKSRNMEDKTIIVVVGVHGLNDVASASKQLRQNELNEKTLRVPLLIRIPGLPAATVQTAVETVDVAPTLINLAEADIPWNCQGRSLVAHLVKGAAYKENRAVFATHLRFADDPIESTVQRVRFGNWTLHFGPSLKPAILRQDGSAANKIATHRGKAEQLALLLEEFQIFNESCIWWWRQDQRRPIDLAGPDGELARARFYAQRNNKKGLATARRIVKKGSRGLGEALEILNKMESKEDTSTLKALLAHPTLRVRALAGALLLSGTQQATALDHVATGLQDGLPMSTQRALLNALMRQHPNGSKELLASYKPKGEGKPELAALRDLALAKLGDEKAVSRLPQHLLAPNATYDRMPIFEALKVLRPKQFVGLCKIILSHGDGDPGLSQAAIFHLFETDSRDAAYAVAQVIKPSSAPSVRSSAIDLLNRWQSHAGVESCLDLGRGTLENATLAARVLFKTPAVFDSPIIPSRRFDHVAAERTNGDRAKIIEVADLINKKLEFKIQVPSGSYPNFALLFEASSAAGAPLDPGALRVYVDVNGNEEWLRRGLITVEDGLYCFAGAMPAARLEPGTNTFSIYIRHAGRLAIKAHALGFVLFPNSQSHDVPIAGLDTHPLGNQNPVTKASGYFRDSAKSHVLWLRRDGTGKPYGEVRVTANGKTFMRIPLVDLTTPRIYQVEAPEGSNRDTKIELLCVDTPKKMAVTGLLIGRR